MSDSVVNPDPDLSSTDQLPLLPPMPKYFCDINLPHDGLELSVKLLLLDLIDGVKGTKAITRKSRLVQEWCLDYPDELGVPGSERRKRTKYIMDRWKRDPKFDTTKRMIRQQAHLTNSTTAHCEQEPPTKRSKPERSNKGSSKTAPPRNEELLNSPLVLKKQQPHTIMTSFGSPLRLFKEPKDRKLGTLLFSITIYLLHFILDIVLILLHVADPTDVYMVNLDNPRNHGDFIVTMSVNEIVAKNNGKKQISSIVILKPNTHPSEIPHLKAVVNGDSVAITSLAHVDSFLQHKDQWMKQVEVNQDFLEAKTLLTTLETLCTELEPDPDDDNPEPVLKTTRITGFSSLGITLSPEYFAKEITGELDLLPLPYRYQNEFAGTKYNYAECVVVWRAYIKDSAVPVKKEKKKKTTSGSAAMDLLTTMMQGTKITK